MVRVFKSRQLSRWKLVAKSRAVTGLPESRRFFVGVALRGHPFFREGYGPTYSQCHGS